jgi:DNA-directed RNA polymerase subunit F
MTYRSVQEALSVLSAVEARWFEMEASFIPLLQKYRQLPASKLERLVSNISRQRRSATVRISDEALSGIIRSTLGESKANIQLAKSILRGRYAERHLVVVFSLTDTAKLALRQLQLLSSAVRTVQEWNGASSTSMISVNGLGLDPISWAAAAALVAGVVIFVVGVVVLIDTIQRNRNAAIARENANRMCEIAAERGEPCTPDDWQRNYEQAARAQQEISPPLIPTVRGENPVERFGDLVFWGGLLVVGAGVGYFILNRERARRAYQQHDLLVY